MRLLSWVLKERFGPMEKCYENTMVLVDLARCQWVDKKEAYLILQASQNR